MSTFNSTPINENLPEVEYNDWAENQEPIYDPIELNGKNTILTMLKGKTGKISSFINVIDTCLGVQDCKELALKFFNKIDPFYLCTSASVINTHGVEIMHLTRK